MEADSFNCDFQDYVDGLRVGQHYKKRARCALISGIKPTLFSAVRNSSPRTHKFQTQWVYGHENLHQEGGHRKMFSGKPKNQFFVFQDVFSADFDGGEELNKCLAQKKRR